MAYKEVTDSSSGSGFLINDGEARALSNSPAKSSYEDKSPSRPVFFFEITNTMQRKRENVGGQETSDARMSKVTRMGLPSPKKVPGYLAVGGPAFPGTSRANVEKNRKVEHRPLWERSFGCQYNNSETSSTGIWGALESYERLQFLNDSEEHIAYSRNAMMRTFSEYSTSDDEATANVGRIAMGVANSALGAEAPRWQVPERQTFRDYLVSAAKTHGMSESLMGENFGVLLKETDEKLRDPRAFIREGDDDMYSRVPARTRPIHPPDGRPYAESAALFNPWGSLNRDPMVGRLPYPASLLQAPGRSAPRDAAGQALSDCWAPLNLEIKNEDEMRSVTRPLGADGAQRGAGGQRSVPADVPEARAVEPEMLPNQAAPNKPLVLITPDDFLTLSNTDISSMLVGVKGNKTDTESVKTSQPTDYNSDAIDGKSISDSDERSLTDSDHPEDSTQSDDDNGSDENEEYIHPMQIISDSIDKVDSWLQKHADVLGAGVTAASYVDVAPLFEMPADDEVVERCQDIKRRECESTLDYARRKLRANCIKFERVAAKFEKLYNEHLLEKCWLAELEAMKIKMSMKRPALNKTKPDEAPAPADINAPGPSGLARD